MYPPVNPSIHGPKIMSFFLIHFKRAWHKTCQNQEACFPIIYCIHPIFMNIFFCLMKYDCSTGFLSMSYLSKLLVMLAVISSRLVAYVNPIVDTHNLKACSSHKYHCHHLRIQIINDKRANSQTSEKNPWLSILNFPQNLNPWLIKNSVCMSWVITFCLQRLKLLRQTWMSSRIEEETKGGKLDTWFLKLAIFFNLWSKGSPWLVKLTTQEVHSKRTSSKILKFKSLKYDSCKANNCK